MVVYFPGIGGIMKKNRGNFIKSFSGKDFTTDRCGIAFLVFRKKHPWKSDEM